MKRFVLVLAAAAQSCGSEGDGARREPLACETTPLEIFERRIEPLLTDDNPKTCNQCHLSGVDFSSFVRGTPCETMACLVADDLVNLEAPEESKILGWIRRAEPDSALITDDVIQAEHDGFLEWIEASARCPEACGNATCAAPSIELACEIETEPEELPAAPAPDCADSAIEQLFRNDVFAWRGRCFPCHFDNQPPMRPEAPRWIRTQGNCATTSLGTLNAVVASGYVDTDTPSRSLLLLKPLTEAAGGVPHQGDQKFANEDDPAYQGFLRFIERFADCQAAER